MIEKERDQALKLSRVRTVAGLPRHWRRIAALLESIPAAQKVDLHVAQTLRGCAWDLDDVLRRERS
jgi:hypothetical protein